MFVFFCFESFVFLLQLHDDINIHRFFRVLRIMINSIFILHVSTCILTHSINKLPLLIDHGQGANSVFPSNFKVISTKAGCNMYDTRTIFSGNEVTDYNTECIPIIRLGIWEELFIADPFQFCSTEFSDHLERNGFLSRFILIKA
ncbi:MAG: hypothetical protein C5S40_00365 [ANME-2 cluster archaeon]|nr:hypothetical protein [ANME-2 cluster archaeon]